MIPAFVRAERALDDIERALASAETPAEARRAVANLEQDGAVAAAWQEFLARGRRHDA